MAVMLAVATVLGWLAAVSPAVASPCLDVVTLDNGWSAVPGHRGTTSEIWLGVSNHGDKDIVMIEGTATFTDALGNAVEPFPMTLPPDLVIPAGGSEIAVLSHPGTSRLLAIDDKLVTPSICVTALAARDGSIIRAAE